MTTSAPPRDQALRLLSQIDLAGYSRQRNFLSGPVTRLSPYLRHGILTLAEVRDHIRSIQRAGEGHRLLQELAWRDYFQRVYAVVGDAVWTDLEPLKFARPPGGYAGDLPQDIPSASTGLACIDAFSADLQTLGYLHNHARMYFASYLVHHRHVAWQAGARFFLAHLLDGDPASNNLSWQWVASTFSNKPYLFNRENLAHYTENRYCPTCPARNACPFDATYEDLTDRLFPPPTGTRDEAQSAPRVSLKVLPDDPIQDQRIPKNAIAWAHEDALSPTHPAYDGRETLAVLDTPFHQAESYSPKRTHFVAEATRALGFELAEGDPAPLLLNFARKHGAGHVVIPASPSPRVRTITHQLSSHLQVHLVPPQPFVPLRKPTDLGRFSRYWRVAEKALGVTASP